jgi:general secretion pathway protein A
MPLHVRWSEDLSRQQSADQTMYEAFYGLRERPFDLTSDSRFMLLTSKHREALSALKYGITGRKGLTLLIGEAGTGKTTVIRKALEDFEAEGHRIGYLSNPTLRLGEFIEWLAVEFSLSEAATTSKARFLRELTEVLIGHREGGRLTGLVVDEAQSLPTPLLEEIRLLSNIETPTEKLFPVVMAGQPELVDRLNEPKLRQLKQRVALRSLLLPLEGSEVAAYLAGRIQRAGGVPAQLFTREAVMAIAEFGKGIPRVISVICDNALIHGLAVGRRPVSRDIIEEVCGGLDLKKVADEKQTEWSVERPAPRVEVSLDVRHAAKPTVEPNRSSPAASDAADADGADDQSRVRADRVSRFGSRSRLFWWSRSVSGVRE